MPPPPDADITQRLVPLPRAEQVSLFRRTRDQCVLIRDSASETIEGLDALIANLTGLDGTA